MTLQTLSRKRFLQGGAAVGGGLAIGGPLAALAARTSEGASPDQDPGYGPIAPAPAEDTGIAHIALPAGFSYRVISRQGEPSIAYVTDPATGGTVSREVPTPGIFDGMGAFGGSDGDTILIRNHENRERAGELPLVVPDDKRYDPNPKYAAGNTKLVVGRDRRVRGTPIHVLGGTSTNCAGGETPWGTWIASEETFQPETATNLKHGYNFEIDARSDEPSPAVPIRAAGAFAHEAVVWVDDVLYQTEDNGKPSGFYRYRPQQRIRGFGDLARSTGPLEAVRRVGRPGFDADTATVGDTFKVEWVAIPDPDPATNTVRVQGAAAGMISFSRLEGCWVGDDKVYFDSTSGGSTGNGQIWEYDPERERLRLVYESPGAEVLQSPDNLVIVPRSGDIWVQEDGAGRQFVRGVTQEGRIYDFAASVLNETEFCGGCFAPDGKTFFLSQQGERGLDNDDAAEINAQGALTYAIWGPFARRGRSGR